MPSGASGLAQFVGSKAVENNADVEYLNANELARRRTLAKKARVQPKSSLTHSGKSRPIHDRRTTPPARQYDQQGSHLEAEEEDRFEASDLSESDDTTRDLDPQIFRGQQARSSFHPRQNSDGGREVEQDLKQQNNIDVVDDGMHEYNNDYAYSVPNYTNEDGLQPKSLSYHNGNATLNVETLEAIEEQMLLCRESEQFRKGEKLHSARFGSSHLPYTAPSRNGRFTSANAPLQGEGMGYVDEARHETGVQWSNQSHVAADNLDINMTDGNMSLEYSTREIHEHLNDVEYASRNRASIKDSSNRSQSSGGSSPSSPSENTPRAKQLLKKPAPTSSKPEKRKWASSELDYDETVLSSMKYSDLKDQPFSTNPRLLDDGIPASLKDPEASLKDLLEELKGSNQDDQMAFFLHMPLDQWEQAGDWFLERFSDLMLKIREARRSKRHISERFEHELADREESVRVQTKNIQDVFKKMKEGGEGVLKGKLP